MSAFDIVRPTFDSAGHFETGLKVKASGSALHPDSGHAPHVHLSWPRSLATSYLKTCVPRRNADDAISLLVRRLQHDCIPQPIIDCVLAFPSHQQKPICVHPSRQIVWLPLRHHPVWDQSDLRRCVRQIRQDPVLRRMLDDSFGSEQTGDIRISWKRNLPYALHYIQKIAEGICA